MSSYKSNAPRRTTESTTEPTSNLKLQEKVSNLQELFPTWSNDDLQSVLAETGGDVELAAARISEGRAEQWGSVTRKKEKKAQHPAVSHASRSDRERHNGETRGVSRGARGGRGRGGSGRGALRVPLHSSHHPHSKELPDTTTTATFNTAAPLTTNDHATDNAVAVNSVISAEPKADASGGGAETSISFTLSHHDSASMREFNEAPVPLTPIIALTESASVSKPQSSIAKVATGSKLSWAQIAKPHEKLKTTPPQPVTSRQLLPSTSIPTAPPPPASDTVLPASEPCEANIWEEPTTVQAPPTWEEEPVSTLPAPLPQTPQSNENRATTTTTTITTTSTTGASGDGWISAETVASTLPTQDTWELQPSLPAASPPTSAQELTWSQTQTTSELSMNTPVTIDTFTTSSSIPSAASIASAPTSTSVSSKPPTPSVTHARPPGIHKTSAKFSKDQAVIISAFAGNVTPNTDKLGMQFGSLSLNGEENFDSPIKTENDSATVATPEVPKQILLPSQRAQVAVQTQPQEPVQSTSSTSVNPHTQSTYPLSTPQQHAAPSAVPIQAQQIQQAAQTSQPPSASFASHPSIAPNLAQQQQPLLAPQHQQHSQHSYGHHQQNVHFDGPQLPGPHSIGSQNSSYFRHDAPFYHASTPPQNAPDHQSGYPAAFPPVGMGTNVHGHSQNLGAQNINHLGGFSGISGGEYSYNDGQRSFYDYVPSTFNSRLGHDESGKSGLPLTQGNQPTSALNSGASQTQNTNGHQSSTTQPPTGQQNQQGYPPMQFFYPTFFPNTYHPPPYPNASYTQPYVPKFPVYPQGPVGPGSTPSGKGIGGGPYNPSGSQSHLYHGQNSFDDPNNGYSHAQSSSNLNTADFQKQSQHHHQQTQQLYSGQQNQGLQSFLNMQQAAGAGQSVGVAGQSRSGTSPETSYKHYGGGGAPDKPNVGIAQSAPQNRGSSVQQGQQQGGSFYPNNRFGSAGGPQQQNQQQGYTQGSEQGQFYSYQHRHQYWQ